MSFLQRVLTLLTTEISVSDVGKNELDGTEFLHLAMVICEVKPWDYQK